MVACYITFIFMSLFLLVKQIPVYLLAQYPSHKINTPSKTVLYHSYYLSFTHAVISLFLSWYYYPSLLSLNQENSVANQYVLSFSLSYFLVDLWYSFYLDNYDYMVHHICAIVPIISSLYLGYSANLIIIGLFFGEATNPIQTLAWILHQHDIKISQPLFLLYNISYLLLRLIISPFIVYGIYKYLESSLVSKIFLLNYQLLYLVTLYWTPSMLSKSVKIITLLGKYSRQITRPLNKTIR